MTSVFRPDATALITGGASGIGLALAQKCHSHGMRVAIVDINREHLELARKRLGERTRVFAMDVGRIGDWDALKKGIEEDFGHIDLLALNAGIGTPSSWSDPSSFQQVMATNLFGVIHGISAFLPSMQEHASPAYPAAVVITGSKQGITNPPGNPAYNASKAAVKSLAEQLSFDLRQTESRPRPSVGVHLLVPGWTYTGLSGGRPGSLEGKPEGAWAPEQVVDFLEEKMRQGSFYVICPDNEVTEETDRRRILWNVGDVVEGRPPLSRWREEWKVRAVEGMAKMKTNM